MTDMASSTRAGVFVMTRTTGVPSGRRSSRKVVGMPAAPLMIRRSVGRCGASSARRAPMSWGLTVRIRVSACLAASALVTGVTPWRLRSSSARSGRRAVTRRLAGAQPARIIPLSRASPIFPVPRTATCCWGMEATLRGAGFGAVASVGVILASAAVRPYGGGALRRRGPGPGRRSRRRRPRRGRSPP